MDLRPTLQHDDILTVGELDAVHTDITSRLEAAGFVVEDDGWFTDGYDQQHQRHLDDLGHVNDDTDEDVAS